MADVSSVPDSCIVTAAGQSLHLLPDPALWWPDGETLFIADLHIGKAAVFRARGLPVPSGTTGSDLQRLEALLARRPARRLVVLGDFLHAAESHTPAVLAALQAWRLTHAGLQIVLVRGNHDSHAGDPPASLGIEVVDEPWSLGPFACCHHPQRLAGRQVLAGHVHPAVRLRGPGRDSLRLPCFSHEPGLTLLPAFGGFTGMHVLSGTPGQTLFVVGDGRVWRVPGRAA